MLPARLPCDNIVKVNTPILVALFFPSLGNPFKEYIEQKSGRQRQMAALNYNKVGFI